MKKTFIKFRLLFLIIPALILLSIESCKKTDGGTGAPVITRVRTVSKTDTVRDIVHRITLDSSSTYSQARVVAFDSTTTVGKLNNLYAIIGENLKTTSSVLINGVSVYFNPALVTDNTVQISIPNTVPYGPTQSNKLTLTTNYGSVEFGFSIQQPAPTITSFSPLAGSTGDIVTIVGTAFDNLTSVMFGTVPAQIVSSTKTQIQVRIPAGIVQANLFVTTPGGTAKSTASYGFKALIYDDVLTAGWGNYTGYNSTRNFANTANVKRGTNSISVALTDSYGALQIGYGGPTITTATAGLTAIKFSIYGGPGVKTGDKVQVVMNGDYNHGYLVTLTAGAYTDYTIPLSSLGNPATIGEFTLQAYGLALPSTFYVDDIGFL